MKLCIPVIEDQGIESRISAHFGSAPHFAVVESDTGECRIIANNNQHHAHGMCHPLTAIGRENPDAVIVGGIGAGALNKLLSAGIDVYLSDRATVEQALEAFKNGQLARMDADAACGAHGYGYGHGHGHGHMHGHGHSHDMN